MFKVFLSAVCIFISVCIYAQAGISADGKYIFITEDKTTDYSGNTLVIQSVDGAWKKEIKKAWGATFIDQGHIQYSTKDSLFVLELGSSHITVVAITAGGNKKSFAVNEVLPDSILQQYSFKGEVIAESKSNILFYLQEKTVPKIPTNSMDLWSYTDIKNMDAQLRDAAIPRKFAFCYNKQTSKFISVTAHNEVLGSKNEEYAIVYKLQDDILTYENDGFINLGYSFVQYGWNKGNDCSVYLLSLKDGSRKLLKDNATPMDGNLPHYWLFPSGKHILYKEGGTYYSYEIANGTIRKLVSLTSGLNSITYVGWSDLYKWMTDDLVLLKDAYSDLWKVSLSNKFEPINITKGFFRKTYEKDGKVLRLMTEQEFGADIICRIHCPNRYINDGIYLINTSIVAEPRPFIQLDAPYQYDYFQKAESKDIYLVRRQTAVEPPKYFLTSDFKKFNLVTGNAADQRPPGIANEVMTWKTSDGHTTQGVLFKPKNFDSTKKYPVVFVYYEYKNQPHNFYFPYGVGDLVDHDYLVFSPDMNYKLGETGQSALNTVVSAAHMLSKKKYVDSKRMGLRGGSFGGYQTNFIVTHTNLFAAAISGAGYSDFISNIGTLDDDLSHNRRPHGLEGADQNRLGVSMWERPDIWIKNSPLFYAERVAAPLLIVHSMTDGNIPFEQNVAFFRALKFLGKKVWMMQIDNGGHVGGSFSKSMIGKLNDNCDMCTRQIQFFNHYLKGEPAALWMLDGISAREKGKRSGLELDSTGRTPGPGLRRDKLILTEQQEKLLKHRTMVTNDGRIVDVKENKKTTKKTNKKTNKQ